MAVSKQHALMRSAHAAAQESMRRRRMQDGFYPDASHVTEAVLQVVIPTAIALEAEVERLTRTERRIRLDLGLGASDDVAEEVNRLLMAHQDALAEVERLRAFIEHELTVKENSPTRNEVRIREYRAALEGRQAR